MHRTRRFMTAAVLVAGLGLLSGACSSSDSAGDTTTTEKKSTTTTEAGDTSTDSTVSDEDFEATIGEITDQIDATGGDTCELLEVLTGMGSAQLPDPSTPAQVEAAVSLVAQLYTAIADAAPAEYAAEGETISNAMTDFEAQAAEQDYDPEWFNSDEFDPFSDPETAAALTTFGEVAGAACVGDTSTTVAG